MTYRQALQYLNFLTNYEKHSDYSYSQVFKLNPFRKFLSAIGNPQKSLRIIHIAGSKGKGSTAAMVAYILRETGFSVGLYTSPHLKDFRERIRILRPPALSTEGAAKDFEGMISQKALSQLVGELKPQIDKYRRFSFFEAYTALAFLYFKRRRVDFVVLETGLGGRLDATNAADAYLCGITPLSFEHVQQLGNTLAKIAYEKSGIIKKPGATVVSAFQKPEARKIIQRQCKKLNCRLYEVGRQIKYAHTPQGLKIKGLKNTYKNLSLKLTGAHQAANAALAVGLVESLGDYGVDIGEAAIRCGLEHVRWPGRCETVGRNPLIVLDGAQNAASAQVLSRAVRDNFKYRKLVLVLGISSDKDIPGICKEMSLIADTVILTQAATPRAAEPAQIAGYFKQKLYLTKSVKEAKLLAKSKAGRRDLILVTGSLFVVGEFRDVGR